MDQEEGLPGGEAMLVLLTRLLEYQGTLTSQLEVSSPPPQPPQPLSFEATLSRALELE